MPNKTVFALAAHPDDIEFMMGGTLLLLADAGYDLHVMNIANGSCGSATDDTETIIARRAKEAQAAAAIYGATWHPSITDDLFVFYNEEQLRKICAVLRDVNPGILLLQSPQDYMEDHTNSCRLGVSAAFARGMKNLVTDPPRAPIVGDVTVYHALPWGLTDPLRQPIAAEMYVDISTVLERKREALQCHVSQKEWLDVSQGMDSYWQGVEDLSQAVGKQSIIYQHAEGWRRHSHIGFCNGNDNPLADALRALTSMNSAYQA